MPENSVRPRPFSIGYVMRTTAFHIEKSINVSINKTFERFDEFAGDPEKSSEVFLTLTKLHAMRKQMQEFIKQNPEHFKEE